MSVPRVESEARAARRAAARRLAARRLAALAAAATLTHVALWSAYALPQAGVGEAAAEGTGHLVVSELMTGGAAASDEIVEIYNPGPEVLPLEGLELVYVTASGATITRKASWALGAAQVPVGGHVLIANEAGAFAPLADATYAGGLAATGGSLALRIIGAETAIDAVGWGTAASTWMEGSAAPAPAAGHSLERLPGGTLGSGQDTDLNAVDFVEREIPDPQNSGSEPVVPGTPTPSPSPSPSPTPTPAPPDGTPTPTPLATPTPTPVPTASPTPIPTATPTPLPDPDVMSIAAARALPDGGQATVEGVSLSDGTFTDGGGYLVDGSAGIAVLVADGSFARGLRLRVTGTVDDRFAQRTLRADAAAVSVIGPAAEPAGAELASGSLGEPVEGQLVIAGGVIQGAPTSLSGALAFDVDDGSGPMRVVVADATGIDTAAWQRGTSLRLRGVVGQRDSSGSGTAGYRLLPRDPADVLGVVAPTPSPSPSPTPGTDPDGSAPPDAPALVAIADARRLESGTPIRVRGVVTLPSGHIDPVSAVIQDPSGAILLRLDDEAGPLALGEMVEVTGVRSTKSGMETIRVSVPPATLGQAEQPAARSGPTGTLGEPQEGLLVMVRGSIAGAPRKSSAQNTYFDLDDGSGPLRIYVSPRAGVATGPLVKGAWIEVVGVLAQETTGRLPERGYRVWPRTATDIRLLAAPLAGASGTTGGSGAPGGAGGSGGADGASGGGAAGAGPSLAGSLASPRLAAVRPSASPEPQAAASAARPGPGSTDPAVAALLAVLGAALLGGVAWLLVGPDGARRLLGAANTRLRPRAAPGPDPEVAPDAPAEPALRLVPLTVVGQDPPPPSVAHGVAERDVRRDTGRILPPT